MFTFYFKPIKDYIIKKKKYLFMFADASKNFYGRIFSILWRRNPTLSCFEVGVGVQASRSRIQKNYRLLKSLFIETHSSILYAVYQVHFLLRLGSKSRINFHPIPKVTYGVDDFSDSDSDSTRSDFRVRMSEKFFLLSSYREWMETSNNRSIRGNENIKINLCVFKLWHKPRIPLLFVIFWIYKKV